MSSARASRQSLAREQTPSREKISSVLPATIRTTRQVSSSFSLDSTRRKGLTVDKRGGHFVNLDMYYYHHRETHVCPSPWRYLYYTRYVPLCVRDENHGKWVRLCESTRAGCQPLVESRGRCVRSRGFTRVDKQASPRVTSYCRTVL